MTDETKMQNFERLVIGEAQRKREEAEKALLAEKDEKTAAYKKEAILRFKEKLLHETEKINRTGNEKVSERLLQGKRNLLCLREKLIEQVFDGVRQRLDEYTKTEEYIEAMSAKIQAELAQMSDDYTVVISEKDTKLAEYATASGLKYALTPHKFYGGCKITDNKSKTRVDLTLQSRLEQEFDGFLEKYNIYRLQ